VKQKRENMPFSQQLLPLEVVSLLNYVLQYQVGFQRDPPIQALQTFVDWIALHHQPGWHLPALVASNQLQAELAGHLAYHAAVQNLITKREKKNASSRNIYLERDGNERY
jgi:hypothetical protein